MLLSEVLYRYTCRKRLTAKTVSVYHTTIRQLGEHLQHEPLLDDMSDDMLLAFERWLSPGRSAYTVRERSGRVKALWRFAARNGWCTTWPSLDAPPVPELSPRAYDIHQIEQLIIGASRQPGQIARIPASHWWRAWIIIAWVTGERTGALRKLRWEHADLSRGLLDVPGSIRKTGKAAMYDLPDMAVDVLREIQGDWPLVFPWPGAECVFYRRFNDVLRTSGLPTGRKNQTQRIRRSHLTYWQAGGGDACARAQHSSAGVTWRHYLDRSLLPRDKPQDRLPPLRLFDAG